uniref:Uncharacterized protein n=1 Tax=Bracon brevicornis TaxID=1563983 RepID=A0A6V7LXJ4_9HYME
MDRYYLDVNLRRWAMIQFSSHLWKQREMKEHLAKTSVKLPILTNDTVPTQLREKLDKLMVPQCDKDELKFVVGSMGTRIRNWLLFYMYDQTNCETKEEFVSYIDHLCWNHVGCINLTETNKSLYTSGLLPISYGTWWMLCYDCNEEHIADFWRRITEDTKYSELLKQIVSIDFGVHAACYYWRLRMQNQLDKLKQGMRYFGDLTVDECMFSNSFNDNYFNTLFYFWKRLNEDQRERMLEKQRKWLERWVLFLQNDEDNWFQDCAQDTNTLMFVIQQYSSYGFQEFLVDMLQSGSMLAKMLVTWPCQDNFMQALEDSWAYHDYIDYGPIMEKLLNLMRTEKAYIGNDSRARKMFCDLWDKEISGFRKAMDLNCFSRIWINRDMALLKSIVVHQTTWRERETLLNYIINFYSFPNCDWRFLKEFINEISSEVDVKEWFKTEFATRGRLTEDL